MHGHRPTHVEIDLAALRHNLQQVRQHLTSETRILAVVKADAYGHGAARLMPTLERAGVDLFGVAIAEEGMDLRAAGVARPILVLGGVYPGQEEEFFRYRLTPTLFDLDAARRMDRAAGERGEVCSYHLKIDTGMGRVGFRPEELAGVLPCLAELKHLHLAGVISHLAMADEPERPFTDHQIALFRDSLAQVRGSGFAPEFVHIGNSAAIFTKDLPECNLARPGIVLYGALPSNAFAGRLDLRPVMSFRTSVAQLKWVPAGTGVSYAHRFVAERETLLAAIPVGYADGYNRRLSNRGEVLIRGKRAKVAGTVCMDWTLVDVTDIPDVAVGDEVTLLGRDNGNRITAEEWAERIGSIAYEVFCQVSKRVPRVYLDE
ncbi:alanine racemase [Trichloromonas sp.]|uniref:alanine racemase n=1 Tax=Trichloromonas sp. TaxID=3069249 RepID=UPI003D813EEE